MLFGKALDNVTKRWLWVRISIEVGNIYFSNSNVGGYSIKVDIVIDNRCDILIRDFIRGFCVGIYLLAFTLWSNRNS